MSKLKTLVLLTSCALALAACSSVPSAPLPVVAQCPEPPPPPAWTMRAREPNLTLRLRGLWQESQETATTPSAN